MADAGAERSSRRALLTASLGAGAALLAEAIGRPATARAADGDPLLAGESNGASSTTSIINTTNDQTVLSVSNGEMGSTGLSAAGHSVGVHAGGQLGLLAEGGAEGVRATGGIYGVTGRATGTFHAGVYGTSDSGWGIRGDSESDVGALGTSQSGVGVTGTSESSTGVYGGSTAGTGVWGATGSQTAPGVIGWAAGTGVFGASGGTNTLPDTPPVKTGVYGYAAQDASANGVYGRSTTGTGVYARADAGGTALKVAGKALFSRAGKATVTKGRSYVDITVPGVLTSHSVIHATLQYYRTGVAVAGVRPNYPSTGQARIYLTKVASTTSSTFVGWFVVDF